jgi:hypothetical protein
MMSQNDSRHRKISTSLPNRPLTTGLKNKLKATLIFCGIVSANLKMETGRNFSMSGIISGRELVHGRSPLGEQFCVFKIFKMSALFKMAAKTWHTNGG